jgi:hypothetical protein
MKWRQSVRLTEKQEAEREVVESKIQEHLKVLQYYIMFIYGKLQGYTVKY